MSVSQISVFLESRPGHLQRVLNTFVEAGISVRGFCASDTGDYGIARFILDDPEAGLAVLRKQGAAVAKSEVMCLKLADTPGELARIMGIMAQRGINVEYCYSLVSTYIAFSVRDLEHAESILAGEPVKLVSQADLARAL